jgi:FixJ family two-component response regulator
MRERRSADVRRYNPSTNALMSAEPELVARLTAEQVAERLGISGRTVRTDRAMARAFLKRELGGSPA